MTLRQEVIAGDERFLLHVYDSTRRAELLPLGWSDAQMEAFIQMQFAAQSRHYRTWHKQATFSVILVDSEPAGRLVVDRSETTMLIVDIAILPQFRGVGVGGCVVRRLLDEAQAAGRAVSCHVELGNPARSFWEHLGFVACGMDGVHVAMEWVRASPDPQACLPRE